MGTITIGNRSFEAPILVPSVSSFETQLQPLDALRLQYTMREPISLVSAYDVARSHGDLVALSKAFRESGVLLLDSGGYESSRISRYADDRKDANGRWSFAEYARIAKEDIYDLIFSFDYFLSDSESVSSYSKRLVREFRNHASVVDISKLIPVVHVQSVDGKRLLREDEVIDLFCSVVSEVECSFVAIPERELGSGIASRVALTRKISQALRVNPSTECSLHILGCGNLLSFSLLTLAGAVMCDGLEWCRTFAADHFHLHHFQHRDVFEDPGYHLGNPVAEFIISEAGLSYPTSVAVRNLLSFQAFTRSLHARLNNRSVNELIRDHFGRVAGEAARVLEA
jgi:hypothetical protein